jgi:hypothetical protein
MVDDAGCLIDSAAANPSLSSYPILPEISETTMRFVDYSRHSTSVQIASLDCELLTRGDSRAHDSRALPCPQPAMLLRFKLLSLSTDNGYYRRIMLRCSMFGIVGS